MSHNEKQREYHNKIYGSGGRMHIGSADPLTNYVTHWRVKEAVRRLQILASGRLRSDTSILVMCGGEGGEASLLCDLGFTNVTLSDISDAGVDAAKRRDPRLKGMVVDAQNVACNSRTFGVVLIQDGLHHLASPIQGFTEMLRLSSVGVIFLEPHDSLIGKLIGTRWEQNGEAQNYVFRWTKKLVGDVCSSYLGHERFENESFSFWHHNPVFYKLGKLLGGGRFSINLLKIVKCALDTVAGRFGNQFCALIVMPEK